MGAQNQVSEYRTVIFGRADLISCKGEAFGAGHEPVRISYPGEPVFPTAVVSSDVGIELSKG